MNGVIVVDKPEEFTSFDVVAVVRRLSGQRKIGHTGTLDPNATGVLPLLLGSATKAQDIIPNHDKEYVAGFSLGMTSDTLDIWGNVSERKETSVTLGELEDTLRLFRGKITQLPPMYSAVKINGQRLYDLAREGREVERRAREVTVYSLSLLSFDEAAQSGVLSVSCSRGTYIRTLIDDIGKRLSTGAVMTSLDRISACGFKKQDALTLDEIKKLAESGELEGRLMSTESLFVTYPSLRVSDAQAKRFKNGGALDASRTSLRGVQTEDGSVYRIRDREESFLGLARVDEGSLKIFKLF